MANVEDAKRRAESLAVEVMALPPEQQLKRLQEALASEPADIRSVVSLYVMMYDRAKPPPAVNVQVALQPPASPTLGGPYIMERAAAVVSSLFALGLIGFLLVRNEPVADGRLFFGMRVLISLAAAVLGATVPGFLTVSWKGSGMAIRAGGALALFVLTFVYTPELVSSK
jgi:hypothetical protein